MVSAAVGSVPGAPGRDRRLPALMAAGLVDSLLLSFAWTVVVLEVNRAHGLVAAGVVSTAMLLGIALSAPTAAWMAARLDGRRLLRTAAGIEAVLRASVFGLLVTDAPLTALAACVTAMNVVAWTGYAGMRAEVAAASQGAGGLTWYGTVVASVEAVGVALAALLPLADDGSVSGPVLLVVTVLYVLALVPTVLVARGSRVPRSLPEVRASGTSGLRVRLPRPAGDAVGGAVLMLAASAPALLAVALAADLHGRSAVGPAAVAFTVGALAAPALAARVEAHGGNHARTWVLLAVGMVAGWALAPLSLAALCLAQLFAGLCMTALEGLLDTRAAGRRPTAVTAALASATAGRALGSAGGTALLPLAVLAAGLAPTLLGVAGVLLAGLLVLRVVHRVVRRRVPVLSATPGPVDPVPEAAPAVP